MIDSVRMLFNAHLKAKFGHKEEVFKLLFNHERKEMVVNNCCQQIEVAERKAFSINWDANKYKMLIEQVADMFASAVLKHAEESLLTQAKRNQKISEANRIKDLEEKFEADQKEALSDKIISYPSK